MSRYPAHFRTGVRFPCLRKDTDIAVHAYHVRRKKKNIYVPQKNISVATECGTETGFAWSFWVQEER